MRDFWLCDKSGDATEEQRATENGGGATPIALSPLEQLWMKNGEDRSNERPSRRHEAEQRPMNCSGGEGGAEPDAPDGMAGEDLAEGHEEALAGLIFGLISRAE